MLRATRFDAPRFDATSSELPAVRLAPVIVGGVTLVKVDATLYPIAKGDLLVTSSTLGYAMKMNGFIPGTVIGKALEALEGGTGIIRVLVMLR